MTAASVALVVSVVLIATVLRWPSRVPHDRPNERSLHDRPIPRAGGWAIVGAFLVSTAIADAPAGFDTDAHRVLAIAVAVLFCVSLIDDVRGLSPLARIVAQLACALALSRALDPTSGALAVALLAFLMVAATNFYNFMDGSDGLAGAMAVVGFGAYSASASVLGAPGAPAAAIAIAVLPFLVANWPPARVFLGDAGSVPLGFLAAALGAGGVQAGLWGPWFPILVFLPFVADAVVTLLARLVRRERVWQAHRDHHYQRLVLLGAGHRGTLALFGTLMVGCASTAVACAIGWPAAGPWALGGWCAIIALVFAAIDYHWSRRP